MHGLPKMKITVLCRTAAFLLLQLRKIIFELWSTRLFFPLCGHRLAYLMNILANFIKPPLVSHPKSCLIFELTLKTIFRVLCSLSPFGKYRSYLSMYGMKIHLSVALEKILLQDSLNHSKEVAWLSCQTLSFWFVLKPIFWTAVFIHGLCPGSGDPTVMINRTWKITDKWGEKKKRLSAWLLDQFPYFTKALSLKCITLLHSHLKIQHQTLSHKLSGCTSGF